ncbi:Serine-type D-Ala-D-Ala carboxypeptidase [Alteripontixanthobacter maritimus]|uniref:serine-type D-Ala-D-Ala carboxypeptidase n=1 Tax=Alteripontixanthobacter maritimus TaxID=2161824 RepID=A0A369Q6A9_9SPHN|nr:D-alanyl-D-alanine carboxypeptidase family protein [Alteripontixanthobacter maritimus]RDC59960.1 Serine-type D-Ala-D-Ala carboxypeptidase [Alteripontixanthobacter maritimus]
MPVFAQDRADFAPPTQEQAPIALMVDLSTGQTLHSRAADRRFIPASITKVMTLFLAFELMEEGKLRTTQRFSVSPQAFEEWHRKGSTMFLAHDGKPTVGELLTGIATVSANDGSIVLAEGAAGSVPNWVAMMNRKAREIGMTNSRFGTPNGWPDEGHTFVTARDLATLAGTLIERHPQLFAQYFGQSGMRYNGIAQDNHDPITGKVAGADGMKTGFTNEAGYGFLGTAERDGRRLVMVVAGSPRSRIRNDAARSFMEWGFDAFDLRRYFAAGERVASVRVQNGSMSRLDLVSARSVAIVVPKGTNPALKLSVRYEGPLEAPILPDEAVARLHWQVDGIPAHSVPLIADKPVAKASFLRRILNGFAAWFA